MPDNFLLTEHLGVDSCPAAEWDSIDPAQDLDLSHAYLRFREHLEPGDPFVLTARVGGVLVSGLHGSFAAQTTGLFSDPWKMLTGEQFLRAGDDLAERASARDRALALAVGGPDSIVTAEPADPSDAAEEIAALVGPTLVVRGFDTSDVLTAPDTDRPAVLTAMLDHLQRRALDDRWGAIVLPYVDPTNVALRTVLAEQGFDPISLTAASEIPIGGASYDEHLETLRGTRRQRYRKDERAFAAGGLTPTTLDLTDRLAHIVAMESATTARNGSSVDGQRLRVARTFLATQMPQHLRVPGVLSGQDPVACGVHLVGRGSYFVLTFGSSYTLEAERQLSAYIQVTYQDPVRHCTQRRLRRLRLGFEAFAPKMARAAQVHPRETWLWFRDSAVRTRMQPLMDLVSDFNHTYLGKIAS